MENLTPDQLTEITNLLVDFTVQLQNIATFFVGGITGIAFVITANSRWF